MNKQDWTYKKLGEVATFINGYPFKPSDWKDSGRKIIRIQNLNNPNAVYNFYDGSIDPKYLVSNGDVLISWSGSLGVFEWTEDEAILNQHIFKVVFNKEYINKKFFQYVVASRINEMKSKVHGVTMQHITKKEFDIILIPVPPIGEQERIVAELDLLQGIIEKKKEQLKAYDQLAQSIFYTMFGDPIDNPKEWETKKLKELCKKITDGTHNSPINTEIGDYKYITAKNIKKDGIILNNITYVSTDIHKAIYERCNPEYGDVLYIKDGITTGIATINTLKEEFSLLSSVALLKPKGCLMNYYLKAVLNMPSQYASIRENMGGAAITRLTIAKINEIRIPLPPLSLQQEFAEKVEAIERQKALVQQSIEETQTMFDYTMDKYFG